MGEEQEGSDFHTSLPFIGSPQDSLSQSEPPAVKNAGSVLFSKINRNLDEKDLANPAIARMLLDERDRNLTAIIQLEEYRDRFHDADKRAAVSESKLGGEKGFQFLYTLANTIGGVIIGFAASVPNEREATLLGLCGGLLIIVGAVINLVKK